MHWSLLTVAAGVGSAFLLRGFVDGARAGDPEYCLAVGAVILGLAAVATLEKRLKALIRHAG